MTKNLIELGRSMVEMLGVLAVIGVLSIVGIAGYKKAMLRHYANEVWASLNTFENEIRSYQLLNPGSCNWYTSADSYESIKGFQDVRPGYDSPSYCYLNRPDLHPSFANGDIENFYLFMNVSFSIKQFRNIKIDGLCTTLLPKATIPSSPTATVMSYTDPDDGVEYRCYRRTKDVKW